MALRLRRGTDVQRQAIVPLEGELIYTTDTKELYVGDGTTLGGILVSAEVSDDTSPVLGGNLDLNGNNIVGTGNINIDGTITATGNINLGDGAEDNIIVGGQIGSSLIPKVSDSYDLGAAAGRWNKIHAFNGVFGGDVEVGNLVTDGNIVKSDSTVIYDGATNSLSVSSIIGDITGSVFGDDSTTLVDGVNNVLSNGTLTFTNGTVTNLLDTLTLVNTDPALPCKLKQYAPTGDVSYTVTGVSGGAVNAPGMLFETSNGTVDTPTAVAPGDLLSVISTESHDGTSYTLTSGIYTQADPFGTVSSGDVPGRVVLATFNNGDAATAHGVIVNRNGWTSINHSLADDPEATLDVNGFAKLAILTAAPTSPTDGMVAVCDGTVWDAAGTGTQSVVAYLAGSWVALGSA